MIAGVDEVGRGPWAGPVVAAAVCFAGERLPGRLAERITDSKLLTAAERAALHPEILAAAACVGVGLATVPEIDAINILWASHLAMRRAVAGLPSVPDAALVDGKMAPRLPCRVQPVVGGDGLSVSIAAASIVAKVTRDRLMTRLAGLHPDYGWERNFGYGTSEHRAGLARAGVTRHHRRSFKPVKILSEESIESRG